MADVFEHWRLIVADFQREYGIDLGVEFKRLTWRRFVSLLVGLSAQSRYAHARYGGESSGEGPVREVDGSDPEVIDRFRASLFGGR